MIDKSDFIFLTKNNQVILDIVKISEIVKTLDFSGYTDLRHQDRQPYIKEKIRGFPHISVCEVHEIDRSIRKVTVDELPNSLYLTVKNSLVLANRKNIQKILKYLGRTKTKVHVVIPTPDIMITSLMKGIKACNEYRSNLDEGTFYIDVPETFIEKNCLEKYDINLKHSHISALKYFSSERENIYYIYGDFPDINNNFDTFKQVIRHIKMYSSDANVGMNVYISDNFKKVYSENRLYENIMTLDEHIYGE